MYQQTRGRGFGPEVKQRIILGTYVLSAGYYDAYYLKGQKVRSLIAKDFREAFEQVDAIITPTSPVPPFRLGERTSNPLEMYLADIYTVTGVHCRWGSRHLRTGWQDFRRLAGRPANLRPRVSKTAFMNTAHIFCAEPAAQTSKLLNDDEPQALARKPSP